MLEKASDAEVSQFQCYTIRNLDNKLSTESDIEQYKLLNVTEKPLDTRQLHLDVMMGNLESITLASVSCHMQSTINLVS